MQKKYPLFRRVILLIFALSIAGSLFTGDISHAAISKSPRLNIKNLSLTKNRTYKLRVYNIGREYSVSFQSSDTDIAIIKSIKKNSCTIKAKSSGQSVITATVNDENDEVVSELKCNVTVTPPAVSVKFCKKKLKLAVGQVRKVKVSKKPLNSFEQPRFSSDDPSIASISSNGTVTAHAAGKTIIRASIANGKGSVCKITVIDGTEPENPDDDSPYNTPSPTTSPSPAPSPTPSPTPSATPSDGTKHSLE